MNKHLKTSGKSHGERASLRVLHLCQRDDPAAGGAARVAVELVKRLTAQGIEAECLFLYGGPGELSEDIRDRTTWLGLSSSKDVFLHGWRLFSFIGKTKPDIIHHHDGVTWSHLLTLLGYHGIRYGHAHNDGPQNGANARIRFANWVHRKTYDYLIAVSEATGEAWRTRGVNDKQIKLIPNGVDPSKFYPGTNEDKLDVRRKWNIPDKAKVILSVGRLSIGMKGTDDFLRVLFHLDESYYALIAGVGADEELLRTLAEDLGVSERVRFCGLINPVFPCYQAADMLVVTSHFEPFGLMVVEAMACGIPVAAFATVGGVMAVLHDAQALVSVKRDPEALANLIQTDLNQPEKRAASLRTVCNVVKEKYSWDSAAKKLAVLYKRDE